MDFSVHPLFVNFFKGTEESLKWGRFPCNSLSLAASRRRLLQLVNMKLITHYQFISTLATRSRFYVGLIADSA